MNISNKIMDDLGNLTRNVASKAIKRKLQSEDEASIEDETSNFEEDSNLDLGCNKWDDDCQISRMVWNRCLTGYHLMPTCSRDPESNTYKKTKIAAAIRPELLSPKFTTKFQHAWNDNQGYKNTGSELIVNPFKLCIVNNFLDDPNFLDTIRQEFNDVSWNILNMDLYEFCQSQDLKELDSFPAIRSLYNLLKDDVMNWVSELTGLSLNHISATCSYYSATDYLLVHDDHREDRLFAFVLYLTGSESWIDTKGGALQLVAKDSDDQPSEIVRNIFPANNQFVFFPVTNDSYHQVGEVTSLEHCRYSINGWFHTKVAPIFQPPVFRPLPETLFGEKQWKSEDFDGNLETWITEEYLQDDIAIEIQEYFESHSEISLKNFVRVEPFNELLQILSNYQLEWIKVGPPNRFNYEILKLKDLPIVLDRFLQLFRSNQMFALLNQYTGLELKEGKATMKFEFQKWTPGCYSLLGDYNWDQKELDAIIMLGCSSKSDIIGARTFYIAAEDQVEDALITLDPSENTLNLVYRDTARFTKYFSKLSRNSCFYTLICSYSE